MKKILSILLAILCVFTVMGTSVAADTAQGPDYGRGKAPTSDKVGADGAGKTEVFFNKAQTFEWSIPAKTELAKAAQATDYTGSGEVKVTRAMIADGNVLKIAIDGGENYQSGTASAYGEAAKYNLKLRKSDDSNYNGAYFVSYKIEQVAASSNVGDTTTSLSATLKSGEISKDDVLVSIPAGQAVINDDGDLTTPVVEALLFTKTGNAAKVGKYSDLLTFTASVEAAAAAE